MDANENRKGATVNVTEKSEQPNDRDARNEQARTHNTWRMQPEVPHLDIDTAEGQIAAMELMRLVVVPRGDVGQGWWYDRYRNLWAETLPAAIKAAWESLVHAEKESE